MNLSLSESKKKALYGLITQRYDVHMSRFPYAKYPSEPLKEWRKQFAEPQHVRPDMIRSALNWRCGFWQRSNAPFPQKKIAISAIKAWPEFIEQKLTDQAAILSFWMDKLGDTTFGFDAAAFLLHLLHPPDLELADTQRLTAMRDLLAEVGYEVQPEASAYNLVALSLYTEFFRSLLPKMQLQHGERATLRLDRFLMTYGNREALAKLSEKFGPSVEPIVSYLDWDDLNSEHFLPDKILGRANADILFACLLLALDHNPDKASVLTVEGVVELLPLGSGGICNPGSYHYAMIALFGGQKERDFFVFEDEALSKAFTEQANNSTRDMRFYRKHGHAKISINPKYIST
ncbi:hypothetical protein F4V43_07485 [Paenibacillus spiritus]|uniref:Uncharacterized protein n=1 Tax=Paenibacillus spiritus TaxID=2496557 RepID=A0A5J5GEK5_9BACL|nr:hypothetical protein [Paenibacillus spiritus]KAA9005904.1 hypothetical protein F4V43_07485 [Paenibacillus spiritus]